MKTNESQLESELEAELEADIFFGIDYSFGWLNASECKRAVRLAGVFPEGSDEFSYGAIGTRSSKTSLIARTPMSEWLFKRVWERSKLVNLRYKFQLDCLEEPLQIIRYEASEQVDWHIDCGGLASNGGRRKLSMSVQLSETTSYFGGDLEFMGKELHPFARERGSMVCFPSFLSHRVTAVTSGVRYSLVAFVEGTPFH